MHLLVCDAFPGSFHKHVIPPAACAVHADLNAVMSEKSCEHMAGELAPLIGVEDLGAAILCDRLPHCVEAEVRGQRIEDSPRRHSAQSPDAWEGRGSFKFYVQREKDGAGAHDFLRRRKAEACFRALCSSDGRWRSTRAGYTRTSPSPWAGTGAAGQWYSRWSREVTTHVWPQDLVWG